jgi:hypothetical protein
MTFEYKCDKCEKIFERRLYLERHMNRKISCCRDLSCHRCGKDFTKKYDLNNHLNRRYPCENKKEILELTLEIEKEKTKQVQMKIRGKELDIKQVMISHNQIAGRDINNNITFNVNIANIESLNPHGMTIEEARKNFSYDMINLVTNIFKHQYNPTDTELKNNKCIKNSTPSKYAVKTEDQSKEVKFIDIRNIILNNFRQLIENTEDRFHTTDYKLEKRIECLTEEIMDIYKNSIDFTHNIRNNGLVNKALTKAVK